MTNKKLLIGISGASGSIYAKRLLDKLEQMNFSQEQVKIICSTNSLDVWKYELQTEFKTKFEVYDSKNFFAPAASGSAKFTDMVIIPCSMGTMGRIAHGISNDLMTRAADVMLKEKRKLILVLRDTPYNLIHIENMRTMTLAGATIMPASPSFYSKPSNFDELADTVVDRIFDHLKIDVETYRWGQE